MLRHSCAVLVNRPTSNWFAFQCITRSEFVGHAIYCEAFDIRKLSSSTSTACFRSAAFIFFENPHNHRLCRIEQSCRWFFFCVACSAKTLPKLSWSWKSKRFCRHNYSSLPLSLRLPLETYATSESTSGKISQKLFDQMQKDFCITPYCSKKSPSFIHELLLSPFFSLKSETVCIMKYSGLINFPA